MSKLDAMFLTNNDPFTLTETTNEITLVIYNSKTEMIETHHFNKQGEEL